MIKDAINKILELAGPKTIAVGDFQYAERDLVPIISPIPDPLIVNTLTGLFGYVVVLAKGDVGQDSIFIHVYSPILVNVEGALNKEGQRNIYLTARHELPTFPFGQWLDTEDFIVKTQTMFVPSDDLDNIVKIVGNMKEESVKTVVDDGVSQEVTTRTGVASVEEVEVKRFLNLKPYRTFLEVEQPLSSFIIRLRQPGPTVALFEADGGRWRLECIDNIKNWLQYHLGDTVTIIA